MRKIWMVLLAVLLSSSAAFANEGKLISLVGSVSLVRDGQETRLERGGVVRAGDLVKVAVSSAAQLRMSDQSIIALGQSTEFRISDYTFNADKPAEARASFSLLKGAFRTVTGMIGQHARDNYTVKAGVVATIGIRGTHYRLRLCNQDCADEKGASPADGLYGGVSEGLIGVTNESGMDEFGPGEYFYVADAKTRPERLFGMPGQLTDEQAGFLVTAAVKGGMAATTVDMPVFARDKAVSALLMSQQAMSTAADTMSGLTQGQFRPAEFPSTPSQLAHVSPLPGPNESGFLDIGGTGSVRGQIVWLTNADIDLHLLTPDASHVYFGNRTVTLQGGATAQLDHDNLGEVIDASPDKRIENIVVNGTQIPTGQYTFYAHSFTGNNGGLPTTVQIRVTGDGNITSLGNTTTLNSGQYSSNYIVNINGASAAPTYTIQPR